MKKLIVSFAFVLIALTSYAQSSSEHLTFKGIPIEGSMTEFCQKLYRYLIACRVVVRLRDIPPLIGGGIRITVGTREENDRLLEVLHKYDNVMEVNAL